MTPTYLKDRDAVNEHLVESICNDYEIDRSEYWSKTRHKEVVEVRFIVWYILKQKFKYTLKFISMLYEKDHSTVIHGINEVENDKDLKIRAKQFIREHLTIQKV